MKKIETGQQLAAACMDVAKLHKTLYVLGCCGSAMTKQNQQRYLNAQSFNRLLSRKKAIEKADANTFGFDCVCFIKALLWGWRGDPGLTYGGAVYGSNGVPDVNADGMIRLCKDVSKDFSSLQVGEAVWTSGHIGIYVGDGLAVECTYRWDDGVQITAVHNLGKKTGYNGRNWTKHGKLPWITYEQAAKPVPVKPDAAKSFTKGYSGTWTVKSAIGLKLRAGASTAKPILETMPNGGKFRCYGYHTGQWLYGISDSGKEGYCHKSLLVRGNP